MDKGEREAILNLVPYFNKEHRVCVDVGSNKGETADLLVYNCDEMHLIEPNQKLIHYTEIKYDDLDHVKYYNLAVGAKSETVDFWEYEKNFNGLSSVYQNEKWADLPHHKTQTEVVQLDSLFKDRIDFLKIDVEGAEWEVFQGMENLLKNKKIKFIQFEYSDHYLVPGYKGQDIIDMATKYGYKLFNDELKPANFKEDYQRQNYYLMKDFTEDWNGEFIKNTQGMRFNFALEVGCFEGLTTCYICDFLLNPGGRIICVDPLAENYLTEQLDEEAKKMNEDFGMFSGQYERFIRNTKNKPVELKRTTSRKALPRMHEFQFDFIYVDGDHRAKFVYEDAMMCWPILKTGGHILFDDYGWADTKKGIDKFIKEHRRFMDIVVNDYQIMLRKK